MYKTIMSYANRILFRIRWITLSDRERYAYLWNRTRNSLKAEDSERSLRRSKGVVPAIASQGVKTADKAQADRVIKQVGNRIWGTVYQPLSQTGRANPLRPNYILISCEDWQSVTKELSKLADKYSEG
jgi:hypothetical protein